MKNVRIRNPGLRAGNNFGVPMLFSIAGPRLFCTGDAAAGDGKLASAVLPLLHPALGGSAPARPLCQWLSSRYRTYWYDSCTILRRSCLWNAAVADFSSPPRSCWIWVVLAAHSLGWIWRQLGLNFKLPNSRVLDNGCSCCRYGGMWTYSYSICDP